MDRFPPCRSAPRISYRPGNNVLSPAAETASTRLSGGCCWSRTTCRFSKRRANLSAARLHQTQATDGNTALVELEAAATGKAAEIDLVLLDCQMPVPTAGRRRAGAGAKGELGLTPVAIIAVTADDRARNERIAAAMPAWTAPQQTF